MRLVFLAFFSCFAIQAFSQFKISPKLGFGKDFISYKEDFEKRPTDYSCYEVTGRRLNFHIEVGADMELFFNDKVGIRFGASQRVNKYANDFKFICESLNPIPPLDYSFNRRIFNSGFFLEYERFGFYGAWNAVFFYNMVLMEKKDLEKGLFDTQIRHRDRFFCPSFEYYYKLSKHSIFTFSISQHYGNGEHQSWLGGKVFNRLLSINLSYKYRINIDFARKRKAKKDKNKGKEFLVS